MADRAVGLRVAAPRHAAAFRRGFRRATGWLLRSLVGLAATVLLLLVAELALRLYYGRPLVERYFEAKTGRPSYGLAPSRVYDYLHDGRPVRVTTDPQGRRIVPDAPAEGGRPLHVLGDSQAFGWGLSDDETVPAQLQRRLGSAWRVDNRGVPGYTPFDYAAELEKVPPGDGAVLLLTEANDLRDAAVARPSAVSRCGYLLPPVGLAQRLPCAVLSSYLLAQVVSLRVWLSGYRQATPLGFGRYSEPAARVLRARVDNLLGPYFAGRRDRLLVVVPWDAAIVPARQVRYEPRLGELDRRVRLPGDYGLEEVFRAFPEPDRLFRPFDFHLSATGARLTADYIAGLVTRPARDGGATAANVP